MIYKYKGYYIESCSHGGGGYNVYQRAIGGANHGEIRINFVGSKTIRSAKEEINNTLLDQPPRLMKLNWEYV